MRLKHALEAGAVRALDGLARALGWRASLALGAGAGALLGALGVRRRVAEANLARAFPELGDATRRGILARHYRELGRVALEYAHLDTLSLSEPGGPVAEVRGFEHVRDAVKDGRGAILLSGHFGNFELMAAWIARRLPVDVVARPLSNPAVDRWLTARRERAGLGVIRADRGVRGVYAAIRAGHCVAMLADQDARRHGVFVPFLGSPASTPVGPARLAIALKVPIVMGFGRRREDGRHELEIEPPLWADGDDEAAALRLTARHAERLSERVRHHPESWFWLHRRWKTAPEPAAGAAPPPAEPGGE